MEWLGYTLIAVSALLHICSVIHIYKDDNVHGVLGELDYLRRRNIFKDGLTEEEKYKFWEELNISEQHEIAKKSLTALYVPLEMDKDK